MNDLESVQLISELAKEVAKEYSIDFGDLSISEETTFDLMANEVYDKFNAIKGTDNERLILLSTIVALTVENFILNLRSMKR